MKRSRNLRLQVLSACALLAVAFALPAVANAAWFLPEQRLTSNEADQRWPEISGTRIAYEDYRNAHDVGDPNDPDTLFDIRVLDLTTRRSRLLTPYHTAASRPAISGNNVVWVDYGHGSVAGGIYHYNLRTGVRRRLPIASGRELRISGDRLVYEAFRRGSWRIYVYNLETRRETRVTTEGASPAAPDISGKWIVWQDHRDGNFEIYGKNLGTGETRRITNDPASQELPRIDGTRIVWVDERNGALNDDIYSYDLSTRMEQQVTTDPARQFFPAVDGNRVVWMDERNGDAEIYMRDLSVGVELRVTNNPAYEGNPTIDGTRIVYEDHFRPGVQSMDLYMTRIGAPVVAAGAPAVVDYDSRAAVHGRVTTGGSAVVGKTVVLQISTDGTGWLSVDTTLTKLDGIFDLVTPQLPVAVHARVRLVGDADFPPATSATVLIKPRVGFSSAPISSRYTYQSGNAYLVWGYFLPRHRTGSDQIRVRAYHYERRANGSWGYVYKASFSTMVTNPDNNTRSKYSGLVRLGLRGKWRLRAYHPSDPVNAATWSPVRDITVE